MQERVLIFTNGGRPTNYAKCKKCVTGEVKSLTGGKREAPRQE